MDLLAEDTLSIIRQHSKDEESFAALLALLPRLASEQDAAASRTHVADAVPDMLYIYDFVEHRYRYVNEQVNALLGYAPEIVLDVLADRVADLVHPEDLTALRQHHRRIIEADNDRKVYEAEFRVHHADGSWRWLLVRERIYQRDADGVTEQIIGQARDITERKHYEQALHVSEQHHRQIVESTPNAIFTVDHQGKIRAWNRAAAKAFKHDDSIVGQQYQILLHPESRARIQRMLTQVMHNGEYFANIDTVYQCRDGSIRRMISRLYPLLDDHGRVQECVFANTDVTFRVESESALRASERKLRSIIEQSADGLALLDSAGRIVEWNTAYEHITGLTCDSVLERPLWEVITLLLPDPDMAYDITLEIQQQIANGLNARGSYHQPPQEYAIVLPDGSHRDIQSSIFPIELDTGVILGCIARDITQRKQAEQDALELVKERERIAVLSSFIESASHEFRTPLSVINTKLYLMMRQQDPANLSRHMQGIQEQVNAMTSLVNSLLAIARLDSKDRLNRQRTALHELIKGVAAPQQDQLAAADLTLDIDIPPDLHPVFADPDELHYALVELLDNAIHYTPTGGHIQIVVRQSSQWVQISIRDTGIGIPASEIAHIFERFYRVDKSRSTRGFGMGLPIARKIVELHGGHIDVSSTPATGSTFTVYLPV